MPMRTRLPGATVTLVYFHGFTSSAESKKAAYFGERLRGHGLRLRCPDFNEPEFASLTMTRMLDRLSRELDRLPDGSIALIGSSLGGTLAILAAGRFADHVDRLALLAPAVMFAKPGHHLLPPERIEEWRRKGALPFFHSCSTRSGCSSLDDDHQMMASLPRIWDDMEPFLELVD